MLHVILGQLEKVPVAQPFSPGEIYSCMDIAFFGTVAIA
jgi:hypothetical protein